eukprot:3407279-Rhodomonas_salina.1
MFMPLSAMTGMLKTCNARACGHVRGSHVLRTRDVSTALRTPTHTAYQPTKPAYQPEEDRLHLVQTYPGAQYRTSPSTHTAPCGISVPGRRVAPYNYLSTEHRAALYAVSVPDIG